MHFSFVQESMRWLITKEKYKKAESVIDKIATTNKRDKPDVSKIIEQATEYAQNVNTKNYSILDLFTTWERARLTISLMFIWWVKRNDNCFVNQLTCKEIVRTHLYHKYTCKKANLAFGIPVSEILFFVPCKYVSALSVNKFFFLDHVEVKIIRFTCVTKKDLNNTS